MNGLQGFRISPQQAALYPHLNGATEHPFSCHLQWTLAEPLGIDTLNRRLLALACANEILRTRLTPVPGLRHPVQVIDDNSTLTVATEDLRALSPGQQQAALTRLAAPQRDWSQPLSITRVQLSDTHALLHLAAASTHFDLASLKLLAIALLQPGPSDVPDPLQYADYAEWRWSLAEDAPDHPGVTFWKPSPDGQAHSVQLALETPRDGGFAPERLDVNVPHHAALGADLMLAAWAVVLGRLSGQQHVPLEYLFYDLGSDKLNVAVIPGSGGAGTGYDSRFKNDGQMIRAGLNWKF